MKVEKLSSLCSRSTSFQLKSHVDTAEYLVRVALAIELGLGTVSSLHDGPQHGPHVVHHHLHVLQHHLPLEQGTAAWLSGWESVADAGRLLSQDVAEIILTTTHSIQTGHMHGEGSFLLQIHLHHQI